DRRWRWRCADQWRKHGDRVLRRPDGLRLPTERARSPGAARSCEGLCPRKVAQSASRVVSCFAPGRSLEGFFGISHRKRKGSREHQGVVAILVIGLAQTHFAKAVLSIEISCRQD